MLNFFYIGRHYAALFLSLPAPYSWNYTTFTLSTLSNLSDMSFVSRVDYSVTLLTHLTLEDFIGTFRLEEHAQLGSIHVWIETRAQHARWTMQPPQAHTLTITAMVPAT